MIKNKRKTKKQKGWFKTIFGRSFGLWDLGFLILIIWAVYYKWKTGGIEGMKLIVSNWLIGLVIVGYFFNAWIMKKVKR